MAWILSTDLFTHICPPWGIAIPFDYKSLIKNCLGCYFSYPLNLFFLLTSGEPSWQLIYSPPAWSSKLLHSVPRVYHYHTGERMQCKSSCNIINTSWASQDSKPLYNNGKKKVRYSLDFGTCTHAVNHIFEIQYCRAGPPNNQSNHFPKSSKAFGLSGGKLSQVDGGGHGAAVLQSKFPKFQATRCLLSLL